jgi:hypothetical protein
MKPAKRRSADDAKPTGMLAKKAKQSEGATHSIADEAVDPHAVHVNTEIVTEWQLPLAINYLDLFNAKTPDLKGWPVLLDTRISKKQS